MTKFKTKLVTVEAIQLNWRNWNQVCKWLGNAIGLHNPGRNSNKYSDACGETGPWIELTINTTRGTIIVMHGDWIVRGIVKDELSYYHSSDFNILFEMTD